jgi:RHS repeat-associated protein
MHGAGGVGGLLAVIRDDGVFAPLYDAGGNITGYVLLLATSHSPLGTAAGSVVAHYEYDAFGNIIAQSGPLADTFFHRYKTQYYDLETGLYYHKMRYYSLELGRFISRDPIAEEGGLNLYSFCGNDPVNKWDYLGMIVGAYKQSRKLTSAEMSEVKRLALEISTMSTKYMNSISTWRINNPLPSMQQPHTPSLGQPRPSNLSGLDRKLVEVFKLERRHPDTGVPIMDVTITMGDINDIDRRLQAQKRIASFSSYRMSCPGNPNCDGDVIAMAWQCGGISVSALGILFCEDMWKNNTDKRVTLAHEASHIFHNTSDKQIPLRNWSCAWGDLYK